MSDLVFPLVALAIALILGGGFLIFTKVQRRSKVVVGPERTAAEFINVKDVTGNFLYTNDGLVMSYLKVTGFSVKLLSLSEQQALKRQLTGDISGFSFPWKFLAASRPVDISPVISKLMDIMAASDDLRQRDLLRHEIGEMNAFASSGEIVERQFFFQLWQSYDEAAETELLANTRLFEQAFSDAGLTAEILDIHGITQLLNLIHNPSIVGIEDTDFTPSIPFIAT